MAPILLKGDLHEDTRGKLFYNNAFDVSEIKRIYYLENNSTALTRGWQGHKIEQRWFNVVLGSFKIKLIKVDNWENPSKNLEIQEFHLCAETLDVLHVPKGYVSSIQALEPGSKLLVFANFVLGEANDEYRFELNYFN